MKLAIVISAALVLSGAAVAPSSAEEQLVYWPLVTDGTDYRRVAYPREAGPLRILADTEVVLDARRAEVRYWPITREYLADLSNASEAVAGTVEIVEEAGNVVVAEPETYVLWHEEGVAVGPVELVRGEAATARYDGYVRKAREAAARIRAYQKIVAEHQALLEAWLKLAATRPPDLPKPPPVLDLEAPEPYRAYASEPRQAVLLNLPEGEYTIRMRDDGGALIPGSERRLVAFAPLDQAVGYVLRPEDRWTQPILSFARGEVVYTLGQTDLFFQPMPVDEYRAREFVRLYRPQTVEATDAALTLWVPRPGEGDVAGELTLWVDGGVAATEPCTGWRVTQVPDRSRGYAIEPFTEDDNSPLEPDFEAMRVSGGNPPERVALMYDGEMAAGSARLIRQVSPPADALLFLPALLPLALGGGAWLAKRRRR